jgi:CheY-like chemotaxis protein
MHVIKRCSPILIVEDHLDTREMYAWYLRTRGVRVVEACNSDQALHRVRHPKPAVIVVDLSLPAPGACKLIRTLRVDAPTRRIPIIALNGFGYQHYSDEALQAGCCCVLVKPCLPEVLAEVAAIVRGGESPRGGAAVRTDTCGTLARIIG